MKVLVLEDFTYSLDGFTILKALKGDSLELDKAMAYKFIDRHHVACQKDLDNSVAFSPVEETAVIETVKEKKRRRKKKAE